MSVVEDSASHQAESLAERAFRRIEESIVTLQLAPGSMTTEQKLCEAFSLGRTPVREAIQRLAQGYLVTVLARRGILIRPVETKYALMTIDVRRSVERLIVQRAVRYADDHERHQLLTMAPLIEAAAEERDVVAFMRIDDEFNRLIGMAARHEVAARIMQPLHCVSRRLGFLYAGETGAGLKETGSTHARMMRAIADSDVALAEAMLDRLLEQTAEIAHEVERMRTRRLAS